MMIDRFITEHYSSNMNKRKCQPIFSSLFCYPQSIGVKQKTVICLFQITNMIAEQIKLTDPHTVKETTTTNYRINDF